MAWPFSGGGGGGGVVKVVPISCRGCLKVLVFFSKMCDAPYKLIQVNDVNGGYC